MFRYILRGIWYYRSVNLSVMLAVAVSTAVIAGALIVGDSVRSSLRVMSMERLGGIQHVLHGPRFITQNLAERIAASATDSQPDLRVVPALLMTASAEVGSDADGVRRAGSIILAGLDEAGWSLLDHHGVSPPQDRSVVLGWRTAQELQAQAGDDVTLWVELPSTIPRDSLLGERDELLREVVVTVLAILEADAGASRFSLNPSQQLPYNAFVSLTLLQERIGLDAVEASRRSPFDKPGRVNAILVGEPPLQDDGSPAVGATLTDAQIADRDRSQLDSLNTLLRDEIRLDDVGLRLRAIEDRGYLSAESDSMILEDSLADAVIATADQLGMNTSSVQVYLANEIWASARTDPDTRYSMYSIVAGVDVGASPPLGPFNLLDGSPAPQLQKGEILLSQWLADDLEVTAGDLVQMRWHEIGSQGDLPEIHREFRVRGVLDEDDTESRDPDLTPFVDGVTNVESFGDWDQPFEMDMDRITLRDDDYWPVWRATPKAFLAPETAAELWKSRFGRYTSVRISAPGGALTPPRLLELQSRLESEIPGHFKPRELGLAFRPVRLEGLQAAVGANDFTQLFLGFSFFLILSAILLASLMFQLGIQQRIRQVGLLEAVGLTRWSTRRFFLEEGILVAVAGAVLGAAGGVGFAQLMVYGLTTWWVGAVGTQFLLLDVQPHRLLTAAAISLVLAVAVIWLALLRLTRQSPRELLAGVSSDDRQIRTSSAKRSSLRQTGFEVSLVVAIAFPAAAILNVVPSSEAFGGLSWRVVSFFLAGFAWLLTGLMLLTRQLSRRQGETVVAGGRGGLLRLAVANASRSARRSLLTTSLIAFATFVIVAVAAGRRDPDSESPDINSGNGGFTLVAESAQPILFDLNLKSGRSRVGLDRNAATTLPENVRIHGFSVRPGQDASCLNLYQASVPTLLGASPQFLNRGGFRFADTPGINPWMQLEKPLPDVDGLPVIPVIGDLNTLQFSLKKGIGDVVLFPDDQAPQYALQIVGMLDSSIFQGVLVMTDADLKKIAPDVHGHRYFLIETPEGVTMQQSARALETALGSFGFDSEPVSQRLSGFLAVQNTYLSTFQMLGGLGLLVGTIGLAAVMLRNVLERRAEIALMLAVGFTKLRVMRLIVLENTMLLVWGILTGTWAALVAMLPHLLSTGADVPWILLGITLGSVLAIGSLAVILPIRAAARTSVREALASE